MLFVEQRRVGLISPDTDFVWDEDNPTFRISTNLRTIDPHALGDGRLRPPSAIDGEFAWAAKGANGQCASFRTRGKRETWGRHSGPTSAAARW